MNQVEKIVRFLHLHITKLNFKHNQ